jgi:mono/diheme cytochrome c family protein
VAKAPAGDEQHGQAAYQKNCMGCHGFGKVKGKAGSILDPNFLALVSDQGLRTTMIVGRRDWGMPDWRDRIPNQPMTDQDMSDVGAWLASQRPAYASLATQGGPAAPHPPAPHISTSAGQAQSKEGR